MTARWRPVGLIALVACSGCVSREELPYIGRWNGGFDVQSAVKKMPLKPVSRYGLKGFLQLYRTEDRCTLHLEGEQETLDLKGHWQVHLRQISLTFTDIKIDDAGGALLRDPNRAYIDSADYQAAYAKTLALSISSDKKTLTGPLSQIGPLLGTYSFSKDSVAH